jgi:hypothetical protein
LAARVTGHQSSVDRSLFVQLWTDSDGVAQCALYDDEEQARTDAVLVDGRVEPRAVVRSPALRTGRFVRNQG